MATDQYTMTDPAALYADVTTKAQTQDGPGLDADLKEKADTASRATAVPAGSRDARR